MNRYYSDLLSFSTFEERFEYLKLSGIVGGVTFGGSRRLNQVLYSSKEWKEFRNRIILRDEGRDLAMEGYEIHGGIYIHHLNPLTIEDVIERSSKIFDPENVVCVSFKTHNAIHYGDITLLNTGPVIRAPNDTCPWRK